MADPFFDEASEKHFEELARYVSNGNVTAFVGAGLSRPANLPTWEGLYQIFCERMHGESNPICSEFEVNTASSDFERYRNALFTTDQSYLSFMRGLFCQEGKVLPEAYRLLPGVFAVIATTNYDNLLEMAAKEHEPDPVIAIYPHLPGDAKYVYLHGHAAYAQTRHELVLTESDYERAYGVDGIAATNVTSLILQRVCVFIGTSVSDPDFKEVLKHVRRARHHLAEYGGTFSEIYGAEPKWFAFAAADRASSAPDDLLFDADDLREREGPNVRKVRRLLEVDEIKPIFYIRDAGHTNLLRLLRDLRVGGRSAQPQEVQGPVFLMHAEQLDRLGAVRSPTAEQQERMLQLLSADPDNRRYFFRSATNPAWFPILDRAGLLTTIDEPRQDDDGNVQVTFWDASQYVVRVAEQEPALVADLIPRIQTTNWNVITTLSDALLRLPLELALPLTPELIRWIGAPYADIGLVKFYALKFLKKLVAHREVDYAIELLRGMLVPHRDGSGPVKTNLPRYHEPEVIQIAAELTEQVPERIVMLLRELLVDALILEFGERSYGWSGWREAVQKSIPFDSVNDLLVDALREAMIVVAKGNDDMATRTLRTFLQSDVSIVRRIAMFAIIEVGISYAEVEDVLFPDDALFDSNAFHEHMVFLSQHFGDLSPQQRNRIRRLLRRGPPTDPEDPPERAQARREYWRWRVLYILPERWRTPAEKRWFAEQASRRSPPEEPFFTSYSRAYTPSSPVSIEGLRTLRQAGMAQLLAALRNPEQHFQVESTMRAELVWETLGALVREDPRDLLQLAGFLSLEDFYEQEGWHYTHAYSQLARDGISFDWEPLISMAERILRESEGRQFDRPLWSWAISSVLSDGLDATARIPEEFLDRVFTLLYQIAVRFAAPLDREVAPGTLRDMSSHQLNDAAGQAADGLLTIALRCLAATSDAANVVHMQWARVLADRVIDLLDRSLDEGAGGIEVRYAIGHNLAVIARLRPGWMETNLPRLFPENTGRATRNAGVAFISGYLWIPHLYNDLLLTLRPVYVRLVADLGRDEKQYLFDELREQFLANHIVVGWLRGLDGFGFDGLLGILLEASTDSLRGHIARYLGRAYFNAIKEKDAEWQARLWPLMDALWAQRMRSLRKSLQADEANEELSAFADWLSEVPVAPVDIEERIAFMIDHATHGFVLNYVCKYIRQHAVEQPNVVARLARRIVSKWVNSTGLVWPAEELEPLLQDLWQNGDDEVHRIVQAVISDLLQRLLIDFRSILV